MACPPPIVAGSDFIPMSNKRHRPPRASPSIADRIQLAMSVGRQLDGIWVGSWRGEPTDLARVEAALLLVKHHSPLNYARILRELERIWVYLLPQSLGEYRASLRACLLDERYIADPATSLEQIGSAIVHEATHARLDRYGIQYRQEQRTRIEAICFRRELAFAARLPNGAELQQELERSLDWHVANPDYFHDAQFQKRGTSGEVEALRYLGAPEWFIRFVLTLQPMVSRARRLFRFGWR
jgi:hypothetical protein